VIYAASDYRSLFLIGQRCLLNLLFLFAISFTLNSASAQCPTPSLMDCTPSKTDCSIKVPESGDCSICLLKNPIGGGCLYRSSDPACEALRKSQSEALANQQALCEAQKAKQQADCQAFNGALQAAAARCQHPSGPLPSESLWDHNGSVVWLKAEGSGRQFYYETPRAGLGYVGVEKGTLLFDGKRVENTYSGTAYIFRKSCPPSPYAVKGPVSADDLQVTMYGKAPIVGQNCEITVSKDDVLVFTFLRKVP
jgi:hypothetical protein